MKKVFATMNGNLPNELMRPALGKIGMAEERELTTLLLLQFINEEFTDKEDEEMAAAASDDGTLRSTGDELGVLFQELANWATAEMLDLLE